MLSVPPQPAGAGTGVGLSLGGSQLSEGIRPSPENVC